MLPDNALRQTIDAAAPLHGLPGRNTSKTLRTSAQLGLPSFLKDLIAWAESRPDVSGLALVGSHARGAAQSESDVDLVILCQEPEALANGADWVTQFGEVLTVAPEQYGEVRALRVFYGDGMEVEFGLAPLTWASVPLDAGTLTVMSGGTRILYDPAGLIRSARIAATI